MHFDRVNCLSMVCAILTCHYFVVNEATFANPLNKRQREDPNVRLTSDAVIIEVESGRVRHRREVDRRDQGRQLFVRQGFGGQGPNTYYVSNPFIGSYPLVGGNAIIGDNRYGALNPALIGTVPSQADKKPSGSKPLPHAPCITAQGQLGKCASFRQCYPYFKVPNLSNWGPWVFGRYDTCSYYSEQPKQPDVFQTLGVCCVSPIIMETPGSTPSTPPVVAPVDEPDVFPIDAPETAPDDTVMMTDTEDAEEEVISGGSEKSPPFSRPRPAIGQWPPPLPPLPTHPPDHSAPTHPPGHGILPGVTQPIHTTTRHPFTTTRHPLTTTKRPMTTWATKPTTQAQPWPPAVPTHPPSITTSTATQSNHDTTHTRCGMKNGYQDQERIVGGHNSDLNEWPWIVALFNGARQFCGGSLIDSRHIITAAHCVAHMVPSDVRNVRARLGDHDIRSHIETTHVEKKIKTVVRHRGFDMRTLYNDIALLTMDSPVKFTREIRPICLPSGGDTFAGMTGTVIGWGSLKESGPQPAVLQEVSLPIWTNGECRSKYGNAAPGGIVEHMLCAGRASKDSCSGDSGGPLMVGRSGHWEQVGVVSWGIGCGKGQYPGVYSRITAFMPWIERNLKLH